MYESRVEYWRLMLTIPVTESGAEVVRVMAAERLVALGAVSESEVQQYLLSDSDP